MPRIYRREMLRTMVAATAGTAAALAAQPALAAFTPPVRGRRYQKYGGHNFEPNSSFKNGARTDRTYNDNGSIYLSGAPDITNTRVQLPDGALIEEIQFNYFLGSLPPMFFQLVAFDNANGYESPIPTATADSPDPNAIQTISVQGLPVRIDNAAWNYVLRWVPQAAGPDHMLWGARVGYRLSEDSQS